MAKTNAERQADYRSRRALTPKNEGAFRRALLEAYFVGQAHQRAGKTLGGVERDLAGRAFRFDGVDTIIQACITELEQEQVEEGEHFMHNHLLDVLRASL